MKNQISLVVLLTSILAPSMAPCQVAASRHWVRLLTTEGETVDLDTAAVGRRDGSFMVWLRWDFDRHRPERGPEYRVEQVEVDCRRLRQRVLTAFDSRKPLAFPGDSTTGSTTVELPTWAFSHCDLLGRDWHHARAIRPDLDAESKRHLPCRGLGDRRGVMYPRPPCGTKSCFLAGVRSGAGCRAQQYLFHRAELRGCRAPVLAGRQSGGISASGRRRCRFCPVHRHAEHRGAGGSRGAIHREGNTRRSVP